MLNVQNYNYSSSSIAFRGEETKQQSNKQNAGLKTAAVYAGTSAIGYALSTKVIKNLSKATPEIMEKMPKVISPLAYIPIFVATSLGCGAIIDKIINNNADKFEKEIQGTDKKEVLKNKPRADITGRDNVYYRPNEGKKYGTILGAIVLPILGIINTKGKAVKPMNILNNVVTGAVGGLILGTVTDLFAGKTFAKNADSSQKDEKIESTQK